MSAAFIAPPQTLYPLARHATDRLQHLPPHHQPCHPILLHHRPTQQPPRQPPSVIRSSPQTPAHTLLERTVCFQTLRSDINGWGKGKVIVPSERRLFILKIPRGDTNGLGEDEVIVTSGRHAQAEREALVCIKKDRDHAERTQKTEKRSGSYMAASDVGSDKGPEPDDAAQSRGCLARGRGRALLTTA